MHACSGFRGIDMNTKIKIKMKCEDCGHEQWVKGSQLEDGSKYFGSGYDFCDECDGAPRYIEGSLVEEGESK